ncbi:MAG: ABC transporter substrate-binding protein [Burkholderiales bacterium]|nr:ABC transporter substrate-binding protein [Burkholderiales bacterium]
MRKALFNAAAALIVALAAFASATPARAELAPDALVRKISNDVLETARTDPAIQAGDIGKIMALVDTKVMPNVNFEVMTRSAVGPQWRNATPDQRHKLQGEFETLLVRVYSGALTQLKDQTVEITRTLPVQGSTQVVVQSEVRGKGEPIKLDYRLDKFDGAWRIIDVNVGGIWLVQSYRSQFGQVLANGGVDALINRLAEQNKANSGKS